MFTGLLPEDLMNSSITRSSPSAFHMSKKKTRPFTRTLSRSHDFLASMSHAVQKSTFSLLNCVRDHLYTHCSICGSCSISLSGGTVEGKVAEST